MQSVPAFSAKYSRRLIERAALASKWLALAVFITMVIVLAGWTAHAANLEALFISQVTVKPNTAIALLLCAMGILLRHVPLNPLPRILSWLLPIGAALVGLLTSAEYLLGRDLHIDQLFFSGFDDVLVNPAPGRMALVTAITLSFMGIAIAIRNLRPRRKNIASQLLVLVAGALALIALLGYSYGAIATTGLGQGVQIAVPTAICVVFLAAATMLLDPESGWLRTALSTRTGGVLVRRILPFAFLIPFCIGLLQKIADASGLRSNPVQDAMAAVLTMVTLAVIAWRTAAVLEEKEATIQRLEGLLPICSHCRKVRNETDYWQQVDQYLVSHSAMELTHSICPECLKEELKKVDDAFPDSPAEIPLPGEI